jgi:hypothetical protein
MKRATARHHLVQHDAEREDIGAWIAGIAAHLLRGHVADRAQYGTWLGALWSERLLAGDRDQRLAREAEVEDLRALVGGDEQVLGLQIAMDDTLVVRRGKPACELRGILDGLAHGDGTIGQPLAHRLPLEQLHRRVGSAADRTEVMNGEDVRMRERGDRLGLALETGKPFGVARKQVREDLDRNVAIEPRIARTIDLAHAPGADGRLDDVRTEARAGG